MDELNFVYKIKKRCEENIFMESLYYIAPILFSIALYCIVGYNNVLFNPENTKEFYFMNDYSDSISAVLLFIISYYICGLYPDLAKKAISESLKTDNELDYVYKQEKIKIMDLFNRNLKIEQILQKLFMFAFIVLYAVHMIPAMRVSDIIWVRRLTLIGQIYYSIYIILTYNFSFWILIKMIKHCVLYNSLFKNNNHLLKFDLYNEDNCGGHFGFVILQALNISLILYYTMLIGLVILNDYIAFEVYNIRLTFYIYPYLGIPVILFFVYILIAVIRLTVIFLNFIDAKKKDLYHEINKEIESLLAMGDEDNIKLELLLKKREDIKRFKISLFGTKKAKLSLIASFLASTVGSIMQIIQNFDFIKGKIL